MKQLLSRKLLTVVFLLFSAISMATPFKNIHIELKANATGRGKVYLQTEDPSNTQTRKNEDVVLKCTLGENGNDTLRVNQGYMYPGAPESYVASDLAGLYMVWLNAEPADGYELAGYSLIEKEDPDSYTMEDLIQTTYTDNSNYEDPYPSENEFVFNANTPRPEDAKGDGSNNDAAREEARSKNNWSEEPDWKIYAVFVKEGTKLPTGIKMPQAQSSDNTNGRTYTIDGREVAPTTKGLVIRNGKKYIQR